MSEPHDPHLETLQMIWREMVTLNARANTTNEGVATTNERLESLERTTNTRFESLERRFESLERTTSTRFESLERTMDDRFERIETRLDTIDGRLVLHGRGITKLVEEVSTLNERVDNFLLGAHGKEHEDLRARVEQLEKNAGRR